MKNDAIIDSIFILITEYKELSNFENPEKKALSSLRYLIGQSIREYDIPRNHYHVSERAIGRWRDLSTDSIRNYSYRKKIKCDRLTVPTTYYIYKGNNSVPNPTKLIPKGNLTFNDMFHEEHIIPVSLIRDEMLKGEIDKKKIKELLESMHICIILKDEDKEIGRTGNRSINFNQVIKDVYNENGIKLANYKF